MKNVLIGAGHRNKQGGNQYEADMNGKKCRAIMDQFVAWGGVTKFGYDMRCYTPDNGLGWSSLDLNEVPVTGFQDPAWPVDLMVELHSEGGGGRQGAFVIYPDWGSDVDVDVRDHGKVFVDTLDEETGMGYRTLPAPGGVGLMSEKQTGVGLQGFRLGVFRDTEQFRARTTRLIFEQGAHDAAEDRAVMDSPVFLNNQAVAFFNGVDRFFDAIAPGWKEIEEVPPPKPAYTDPVDVPWALGKDLGWQKLNGIPVYSFVAQGVARKRVIKRAWASDDAPQSGEAYPVGTEIVLAGYFRVPDPLKDPKDWVQWYLDSDGNRIRFSSVATSIQVKGEQ